MRVSKGRQPVHRRRLPRRSLAHNAPAPADASELPPADAPAAGPRWNFQAVGAGHRGVHADQAQVRLPTGGCLHDHGVHQQLEDALPRPLHEAVVDGLPGTVLLCVPPEAAGAEPPHHPLELLPQVLRTGAVPPDRQVRPVNFHSASVSSGRVIPAFYQASTAELREMAQQRATPSALGISRLDAVTTRSARAHRHEREPAFARLPDSEFLLYPQRLRRRLPELLAVRE